MVISSLQGRLGLLEFAYSSRRMSKNKSSLVLGVIVFVHAAIILLALNEKVRQRELAPEKTLHMINVLQKPLETVPMPDKPEVNELQPLQFNAPQVQIAEPVSSPLDIPFNDSPYELPSEVSGQYENVFDPKMRQKLLDAQSLNRPRAKEKLTSWTESDGRVFTYMGDGKCLVSMPKVDSRDRGTSWGMTKCGKTDSEKMMDNVNADLEERKHPLNKKGQQ